MHENTASREKVVLVIDDNPDLLEFSKTLLEMEGYKVLTALSGKDALIVLAEPEQPDLILLDMQMGDFSGPDFLIELEQRRPEILEKIPVVFLSAMDRVPASRAVGFIRRPVEIDTFLEAVQRYMSGGLGHGPHKH